MTDLVVIIPTHGRNSLLERTLQSIANCEFPANYLKTIIVENGPKENTEAICAKYVNINCEYQHCEIANKSAALNQAITGVDENTFIIFFDDDIRLEKTVLTAYATSFRQWGPNHFYGGPFGVDYEKKPGNYYTSYLPLSAIGWEFDKNRELLATSFIGFNWAVQKKHLILNCFNSQFGPNSTTGAVGQEHDMMRRLVESGVNPKYVANAKVWHYVPKERSSFIWALKRKYKGGISKGINFDELDHSEIKKKFSSELKAFLRGALSFSRARAVNALFGLARLKGMEKGLKIKLEKN